MNQVERDAPNARSRLTSDLGRSRHSVSLSQPSAWPTRNQMIEHAPLCTESTADQPKSPFLRLPLEIRSMIWNDCFSEIEVSAWTTRKAREGISTFQNSARPFKRVPNEILGLLLLCKATYEETRDALYSRLVLILPGTVAVAQFPGRLFQYTPAQHLQKIRKLVCIFNEDTDPRFDISPESLPCYDLKHLLVTYGMRLQILILKINFKATRTPSKQARDRVVILENEVRASMAELRICDYTTSVRLVIQYASLAHLDQKAPRVCLPENCVVERRWPQSMAQVDSPWTRSGRLQLEGPQGEVLRESEYTSQESELSPYFWRLQNC